MSTICFDIKRKNKDYVCIQHCGINAFEYSCHLPFSFRDGGRKRSYKIDSQYKYVYLLTGKDETGIERIFFATNSLNLFKKTQKSCEKGNAYADYSRIRAIELPFEKISGTRYIENLGIWVNDYETNDMQGEIELYCPIKKNEKYHVYCDRYEETETTYNECGFPQRNFVWYPPKDLEITHV